MIIRPFNHSNSDYDSIIDIQNTAFPDNRCDVADWKARDENYPKKYLRERLVAEDSSSKIVGYSFFSESEWSYQPGKFLVLVTVHPNFRKQGIGSALFDATLETLGSINPLRYESATRENQPEGMRFLERRGFRMVMREPISQLDLTTFDASAYEHYKGGSYPQRLMCSRGQN